MIKNCEICKKEFEAKAYNITCSVECRDERRIVKKAEGNKKYSKNPKRIEYMKKYSKTVGRETIWRSQGIKNMTYKRYQEMFKEQNGCCAICGRTEKDFKKQLSVDHNHKTGEPKGLLCTACNRGLGMFQDNLDLIASAASYLQQEFICK